MVINKTIIAWGIVGVSAVVSTASIIFAAKAVKKVKKTCDKLDVAIDAL